jgi:hypothetical protein
LIKLNFYAGLPYIIYTFDNILWNSFVVNNLDYLFDSSNGWSYNEISSIRFYGSVIS